MSEELEDLKRAYRDIEAPQHLATRIRAEAETRPAERFTWVPIAATALMAVGVAWILPMLWHEQTQISPPITKPSLSALARLTPPKPSGGTPSLAQIRSPMALKTPTRPPNKNLKPQSNINEQSELLKDQENAYI